MYYCGVDLQGLVQEGWQNQSQNPMCWTEFPKDFSAAGTLKVLLPYIQHSLVSPMSSGPKSGCWPSLLFAAFLQYFLETLMVAVLFKSKWKHKV